MALGPQRPSQAHSSATSGTKGYLRKEKKVNQPVSFRPVTSRTTATTHRTRTKTAASTTNTSDQQIICALTESRGVSPTVGLAFVNLSTTEAVFCQIVDNQTYVKTLHKLHVFDPTEIILPDFSSRPAGSKLLQALKANLGNNVTFTITNRKIWDETDGTDYIQNLAFNEDAEALKVSVSGNFFATCCLAAAFSYIERSLGIQFAFHSMRISYEPSDGTMMMDVSTIKSLELIQNLKNAKSKYCLFGLLNQTFTPMGARMLRGNILQPSTEKNTIIKRLDAIEELTSREEIFVGVRRALRSFEDIDKVLTELVIIPTKSSIQKWEQSINNVLLVKHYINGVPAVFDALNSCQSEMLRNIRELCAPAMIQHIREYIQNTLNEDASYQKKPVELRNQRTYAVKAGVNGLLDVARQTYKEACHDSEELLSHLADTYEFTLSLKYHDARQFYFTFPVSELEFREVPGEFVNVFRKKNVVECQTLSLVKLNQKIVDSHHEVLQMSDYIVQELIAEIRRNIAPLFRISESIAMLDMLASLAYIATIQDYTRPEIGSTLAIRDCRHPLHEKSQSEKYIPNDVFAPSTKRLQIITGCNMSGKSTYTRSVATLVIMAQIGSFVPASFASIPMRSQLFARISVDNSSVSNMSTFAAEMRETAFILRNIDAGSLAIIDELGRGTSSRDGLAIAIAVAEALVQSKALVWFVTHFRDLARVLSERPGVVNLHMKSQLENPNQMVMLYEIGSGPTQAVHYGLALASVAGLPARMIEVARRVSIKLEDMRSTKRRSLKAIFQARRRKLILGLEEQLFQAKESTMGGERLRIWMKNLQDEFVLRMSQLDKEEKEIENLESRTDCVPTSTGSNSNTTEKSEVTNANSSKVSSKFSSRDLGAGAEDQAWRGNSPSPSESLVYSPSSLACRNSNEYEMSGVL